MIKFFSETDEQRIITAIREAEMNTSGEIRVHLESDPKGDIMKEALRTFHRLGMHKTKQRNGVLILLAPQQRQFAIIGDEGIDEVVPEDFWNEERDIIQEHFRRGDYGDGVVAAIQRVGEKLKAFFPRQDDDVNELSDEISYD